MLDATLLKDDEDEDEDDDDGDDVMMFIMMMTVQTKQVVFWNDDDAFSHAGCAKSLFRYSGVIIFYSHHEHFYHGREMVVNLDREFLRFQLRFGASSFWPIAGHCKNKDSCAAALKQQNAVTVELKLWHEIDCFVSTEQKKLNDGARERRGAGSSLVSMQTPYYKTIY